MGCAGVGELVCLLQRYQEPFVGKAKKENRLARPVLYEIQSGMGLD